MNAGVLYIGLDAGATKTRLYARCDPSGTVIERVGGGANLQRQGVRGTADVLLGLVNEVLQACPRASLAGLCAGVAGAGEAADQRRLAEALRTGLGPRAPARLLVVHDAQVALEGAFEGGSGMIIIAGTGSALFARTQAGTLLRAGGWGYLLGDEGSGHALGMRALHATAAAFDGGPSTLLHMLLAERHGLATPDVLKRRVYQDHWPVQEAAPLVLEAAEAGDAVALHILQDETHALAQQAAWLARRASDAEPRIALLGGLTRTPTYRDALTSALHHTVPDWRVVDARHPPEVGALRLAIRTGYY